MANNVSLAQQTLSNNNDQSDDNNRSHDHASSQILELELFAAGEVELTDAPGEMTGLRQTVTDKQWWEKVGHTQIV